ncbi:hypothetical protein VA249_45820 (plasmid) [Vibrio alfacsensis]|uniref:hypothetical protein n=1 Tax=Vibrio alfacsensis TaxID=1074311 RepID=UPI001BED8763|nr:hypothetical protein [Vibrio alfacsensis]BBM67936.1 hypothetical protein VA249_45820 [Vibrio alfacsensis]
MKIIYPKKAPSTLIKRTEKAIRMLQNGAANFRTSTRFGYQTLALGHCERMVKIGDTLHIFNRHSDYERFINQVR